MEQRTRSQESDKRSVSVGEVSLAILRELHDVYVTELIAPPVYEEEEVASVISDLEEEDESDLDDHDSDSSSSSSTEADDDDDSDEIYDDTVAPPRKQKAAWTRRRSARSTRSLPGKQAPAKKSAPLGAKSATSLSSEDVSEAPSQKLRPVATYPKARRKNRSFRKVRKLLQRVGGGSKRRGKDKTLKTPKSPRSVTSATTATEMWSFDNDNDDESMRSSWTTHIDVQSLDTANAASTSSDSITDAGAGGSNADTNSLSQRETSMAQKMTHSFESLLQIFSPPSFLSKPNEDKEEEFYVISAPNESLQDEKQEDKGSSSQPFQLPWANCFGNLDLVGISFEYAPAPVDCGKEESALPTTTNTTTETSTSRDTSAALDDFLLSTGMGYFIDMSTLEKEREDEASSLLQEAKKEKAKKQALALPALEQDSASSCSSASSIQDDATIVADNSKQRTPAYPDDEVDDNLVLPANDGEVTKNEKVDSTSQDAKDDAKASSCASRQPQEQQEKEVTIQDIHTASLPVAKHDESNKDKATVSSSAPKRKEAPKKKNVESTSTPIPKQNRKSNHSRNASTAKAPDAPGPVYSIYSGVSFDEEPEASMPATKAKQTRKARVPFTAIVDPPATMSRSDRPMVVRKPKPFPSNDKYQSDSFDDSTWSSWATPLQEGAATVTSSKTTSGISAAPITRNANDDLFPKASLAMMEEELENHTGFEEFANPFPKW